MDFRSGFVFVFWIKGQEKEERRGGREREVSRRQLMRLTFRHTEMNS